jgi:hypothetical protein
LTTNQDTSARPLRRKHVAQHQHSQKMLTAFETDGTVFLSGRATNVDIGGCESRSKYSAQTVVDWNTQGRKSGNSRPDCCESDASAGRTTRCAPCRAWRRPPEICQNPRHDSQEGGALAHSAGAGWVSRDIV